MWISDFITYIIWKNAIESAKVILYDGDRELAISVLRYSLSQIPTADPRRLAKVVAAGLKEEDNIMGTLVDYLTEKNKGIWLQSGIQQGKQAGIKQGESMLIIHQLKRKFKTIPEQYLKQVEQATPKDLLKLADRILENESLEEGFREEEAANS